HDSYSHGDIDLCVNWSRPGLAIGAGLAGLVLEQVDRVGGVMPEEMVGPAARIAGRIDVLAAEKIGLHVHLLDRELALLDALVDPLVAGVEAADVTAHGDDAGLLGDPHQVLGILDA